MFFSQQIVRPITWNKTQKDSLFEVKTSITYKLPLTWIAQSLKAVEKATIEVIKDYKLWIRKFL